MSDLVLLPGMLGDATAWDDVVAQLSGPTSIGTGRLECADNVPELDESVLAQAPPSFVLAGHSFGANVALETQRLAPRHRLRREVGGGFVKLPQRVGIGQRRAQAVVQALLAHAADGAIEQGKQVFAVQVVPGLVVEVVPGRGAGLRAVVAGNEREVAKAGCGLLPLGFEGSLAARG